MATIAASSRCGILSTRPSRLAAASVMQKCRVARSARCRHTWTRQRRLDMRLLQADAFQRRSDTESIGREAMRTICEMMNHSVVPQKPIVRQVPPKGVVVRTSTETYPVDPPWLSDALVFIRRHVADRLSASDIYARTGLSHTVVDMTFRNRLGHSVQKEIAAARLEKAKHMLASGNASVAEIANASGFASTEYFIRAFNAASGQSPSKWRASRI